MEEHRFDQYRVALFSGILGLITCRRVRFSHQTERLIRWIGAGKIGRAEGRIGVHVESEGVLKCEGYNEEGTCDMLCSM